MKIRQIIENDIVEDISLYKTIQKEFINFIKEEIKEDYVCEYSFDEFCTKMINNYEGIDDDVTDYLDIPGRPLTKRLFKAVMKIALDEFKNDENAVKLLEDIIENNDIDTFSVS